MSFDWFDFAHHKYAQDLKQKGLAPILIVVLIAALVGGYFVYTSLRGASETSNEAITPTSTPVVNSTPSPTIPDETANWKTYSGKYFTFKYPNDWETIPLSTEPAYYNPSLETIKLKISSKGNLLISTLDKNENPYQDETSLPNTKLIKVGTRDAVRFDSTTLTAFTRISIKGDDKVGGYVILFEWISNSEISETLLNQILSTFKFIE